VDKERGVHGYSGVLPGIPLHGPAMDVTNGEEKLLKRTTKIRTDGAGVRLSLSTG
jgi:hypothetical protein